MTMIRGKLDPKETNSPAVGTSGAPAGYKFAGGKLVNNAGEEVKNALTLTQFLSGAEPPAPPSKKTKPKD